MKKTFVWILIFFCSHPTWAKKNKMAEDLRLRMEEPFILAPLPDEVCFSPGGRCDIKLVRLIQSAQKSIDLAAYDMTLDQVAHHLLVKSKKIPVRFLFDRRQSKGKESLVGLVVKAGGNVRYGRQRGIMHHKFMIVDGKWLQVGSFNYSNGAAFKNQENQIYLTNPQLIQKFQTQFEVMWSSAALK